MRFPFIAAAILAMVAIAATPPAQARMSSVERTQIEEILRDYLLENPELILETLEILEQRRQAEQTDLQKENLARHREELENDAQSPVLGNPDGDVTLVEFFDYQCIYCKQASGTLRELLASDPNIRLVMKEFPVLGPASLIGARAALAAEKQDGYEALHQALMDNREELDEERVVALAGEAGLDIPQLRTDMNDPEIQQALRRNYSLAETLGIRGTPAFVIGDQLLPGLVPLEDLQEAVEKARKTS